MRRPVVTSVSQRNWLMVAVLRLRFWVRPVHLGLKDWDRKGKESGMMRSVAVEKCIWRQVRVAVWVIVLVSSSYT